MQDGPTTVFKGEVDAAVSRLVPFPSPLSVSVCMMRKDPRDRANFNWTRGWQLRGLAHLIARLPNQERDLFPPEIRIFALCQGATGTAKKHTYDLAISTSGIVSLGYLPLSGSGLSPRRALRCSMADCRYLHASG